MLKIIRGTTVALATFIAAVCIGNVVGAEIQDKHDYLICSGISPWNNFGPFTSNKKSKVARIKIERHGFAEETLHIYWRVLDGLPRQGQDPKYTWLKPDLARVQYNHSEDGVWYVGDVSTPRLPFFSARPYSHVIQSFHRPWNNRWIRVYRQFIPGPWISNNPDYSGSYGYRVEAYEMPCYEISPFD